MGLARHTVPALLVRLRSFRQRKMVEIKSARAFCERVQLLAEFGRDQRRVEGQVRLPQRVVTLRSGGASSKSRFQLCSTQQTRTAVAIAYAAWD